MDQELIRRIVEAALLAAGQPLNLVQLGALFPEDQPAEPGSIERALESLREESPRRGIELVEVASGFRFQIRDEVQPWVGRLWAERQTRYSRAQLETLALIAYRQPITRGEIEQIRGVTVSSHIIRTLEDREWIRVVGHRDVPGRPALFGTTRTFLDYFNLSSLDQLPPLAELRDIPDFDPQLSLEPPPATAEAEALASLGQPDPVSNETAPDAAAEGPAETAEPVQAVAAPGEMQPGPSNDDEPTTQDAAAAPPSDYTPDDTTTDDEPQPEPPSEQTA